MGASRPLRPRGADGVRDAGRADYAAELESWRTDREERLQADDGWLTVAGLFFLNEGDNSFGSSPLNDIVLRTGPAHAGVFSLRDDSITVRAPEGETLSIDGREVAAAQLWPYEGREQDYAADDPGGPTARSGCRRTTGG